MYQNMGAVKSRFSKKQRPKVVEVPISALDAEILQRIRPPRQSKISNSTTYSNFTPVQEEPLDLTVDKDRDFNFRSFDSIGRCSTPSDTYCDHCDHMHGQECCLYVHDTDKDMVDYSLFMQFLERGSYSHSQSPLQLLPEAIAGNTTPPNFPSFTDNDPKVHNEKMAESQSPMLFIQQYATFSIWNPVIGQILSQVPPPKPTPSMFFPASWHHVHPQYMLPQPVYENVPYVMPTVFNIEQELIQQQNMAFKPLPTTYC